MEMKSKAATSCCKGIIYGRDKKGGSSEMIFFRQYHGLIGRKVRVTNYTSFFSLAFSMQALDSVLSVEAGTANFSGARARNFYIYARFLDG